MLQRAPRLPTRILIHVRTGTRAFDATIGNLSTSGARLLGVPDKTLHVGQSIDIYAVGRNLSAEVRWHVDDTCGLQFHVPLQESDIVSILSARTIN